MQSGTESHRLKAKQIMLIGRAIVHAGWVVNTTRNVYAAGGEAGEGDTVPGVVA